MATGMDAPAPRSARFDVGAVLEDSFSVWFHNLVPFLVLAAIVQSPVLVYFAAILAQEPAEETLSRLVLVGGVGSFLLDFVVTGAIAYGVYRRLCGVRAGILDCITTGLRRMLPVLGVGILVVVGILAGLVLLIVPGLVLACTFYVAVPVAVVEKIGVRDALERSASLTAGSRYGIFGILVLFGVLSQALERLLDLATGEPESMADARRSFWILFAVMVAVGLLQSVAQAVSYYHLRVAKEGFGIAELREAFDGHGAASRGAGGP